jgi:hypothetical protein
MAQSFTREQALDYLQDRGLLTKARDKYSTAYAKRLASSAARAQEEGKGFSRAKARGKAGPEHIVPNYEQRTLQEGEHRDRFSEQYRLVGPTTTSDLRSLKTVVDRRRKAKGLPKATKYLLVIHGKSKYKHPKGSPVYTEQTLALYVESKELNQAIKENQPIVDFVNELWSPLPNSQHQQDEWEEVYSISIKVGK